MGLVEEFLNYFVCLCLSKVDSAHTIYMYVLYLFFFLIICNKQPLQHFRHLLHSRLVELVNCFVMKQIESCETSSDQLENIRKASNPRNSRALAAKSCKKIIWVTDSAITETCIKR
jgi:hypothetical protein